MHFQRENCEVAVKYDNELVKIMMTALILNIYLIAFIGRESLSQF